MIFPANYLTKNAPVMSQYRNLFGGGLEDNYYLAATSRSVPLLLRCGEPDAASDGCLNLAVNRIISTRNTKVEWHARECVRT